MAELQLFQFPLRDRFTQKAVRALRLASASSGDGGVEPENLIAAILMDQSSHGAQILLHDFGVGRPGMIAALAQEIVGAGIAVAEPLPEVTGPLFVTSEVQEMLRIAAMSIAERVTTGYILAAAVDMALEAFESKEGSHESEKSIHQRWYPLVKSILGLRPEPRLTDGARLLAQSDPYEKGTVSGEGLERRVRENALSIEKQVAVRAHLEPITANLERLRLDDPSLSDEDERYLQGQLGTLREQLRLEVDGDPLIIERAIANIVRRFRHKLFASPDGTDMISDLMGCPTDVAQLISNHLDDALRQVEEIGQADPVADADQLTQIAGAVASLQEGPPTPAGDKTPATSRKDMFLDKLVTEAGGAAGKMAAGVAGVGALMLWRITGINILVTLRDLVEVLTKVVL